MTKHKRARSFEPNADNTITTETGHVAHRDLVDHSKRLVRDFYKVGDHVWCLVGNGLSNQTFIDAPDGIIAIDTGESNEEMHAAISELRLHTKKPIVAVLYTHFHYVAGTQAVLDESPEIEVEIYGHSKIAYTAFVRRLRSPRVIAAA